MAEQLAALSALLGQQLEAEGWGQEAAAAAVVTAGTAGQLEPLLQVGAGATLQGYQAFSLSQVSSPSAIVCCCCCCYVQV
jgi:hypothetical protein